MFSTVIHSIRINRLTILFQQVVVGRWTDGGLTISTAAIRSDMNEKVANHMFGSEESSFRWSSLDHKSIEEKLGLLKWRIEKEIKAAERLAPIPDRPDSDSFKTSRQAHSFELLQLDRADDWVTRAYKIYCDNWEAKGGKKTQEFVLAVWCNAVYYFVTDDVLKYLRLVFCVDDRTNKLSGREYGGLPQGVEATSRVLAVNRIYENLLKLWNEEKIPAEVRALKPLIAIPDQPSTNIVNVKDFEPVKPTPETTAYDRTKEKNLRAKLTQTDADQPLLQELVKELTEQQRVANALTDLQGQQLAILVFGRTASEIAEEIRVLGMRSPSSELGATGDRSEVTETPMAAAAPIFRHSDTYDSITFKDQTYTLQDRQAATIRILHEAVKKGHPAVAKKKLLNIPGCEDVTSVRDIFKSRPQLWRELIVNCEDTGEGRGFYRLHPSITA